MPKSCKARPPSPAGARSKANLDAPYKEIAPEQFVDALGLVARIELEGEYIPAKSDLPPIDVGKVIE
jgi:hypothetical protein